MPADPEMSAYAERLFGKKHPPPATDAEFAAQLFGREPDDPDGGNELPPAANYVPREGENHRATDAQHDLREYVRNLFNTNHI